MSHIHIDMLMLHNMYTHNMYNTFHYRSVIRRFSVPVQLRWEEIRFFWIQKTGFIILAQNAPFWIHQYQIQPYLSTRAVPWNRSILVPDSDGNTNGERTAGKYLIFAVGKYLIFLPVGPRTYLFCWPENAKQEIPLLYLGPTQSPWLCTAVGPTFEVALKNWSTHWR